jgi:hypothetical protein
VDFPGGRQVCGDSLVFSDVESSATRYIVAPIPGTDVVGGSLSESARGSKYSERKRYRFLLLIFDPLPILNVYCRAIITLKTFSWSVIGSPLTSTVTL